MTIRNTKGFILILFILPPVFSWTSTPEETVNPIQANLVAAASPEINEGFTRADGSQPIEFPADHGPHPDYQTEWWYFTGNLNLENGQSRNIGSGDTTPDHFGYQLTFFRRALIPSTEIMPRESNWATSQIYMAHFALTDVVDSRYNSYERLSRGAAGLSGAIAQPFSVWLEDWLVEEITQDTYHLVASQDGISLDLILVDAKEPILQGDQGYSQKGPDPGQASYYYSLTHLETTGTIRTATRTYNVTGTSWMDHEYSTSALSPDQIGWDWFSIQLDNDNELMVFQIRKSDGSVDPFSSGIYIAQDASKTPLNQEDFSIRITDYWTSPRTNTVYPAGWELSIPSLKLTLKARPFLPDQEFYGSYSYWEGAVQVEGEIDGGPLTGSGYVELTGYTRSMGGEF